MNGNTTENNDERKINWKKVEWAQFPDDLLTKILWRLFLLSDQVRFRAVCKNWLHVVHQHSDNNNNITVPLPWVINIESSLSHDIIECRLYEPSPSSNLMNPTFVYKINLQKLNIIHYGYGTPTIDTSTHKNGWIFSSIGFQHCKFTSFLLFSPLIQKEIILPRLAFSQREYKVSMKTFSTKPDSPDCFFVVMCRGIWKNTFILNVYRHGYKRWKSQEYSSEGFSLTSMPVYIEGIFYFVFPTGQLVSYNVSCEKWMLERESDISFPKYVRIYKAFELNGELMVIGNTAYDRGYIRMFERSTKAWVPLESLEDHSIFICDNSVVVPIIAKGGKGNYGGVLPNKIYCCSYPECGVYSFESGKTGLNLLTFAGSGLNNLMILRKGKRHVIESQAYAYRSWVITRWIKQ